MWAWLQRRYSVVIVRNVAYTDYNFLANMDWSPLTRPPTGLFVYFVVDQAHVCFVAQDEDTREYLGALTAYRSSDGNSVHLAAVKAFEEGKGTGSALVLALQDTCKRLGVKQIWLFCTEDVQGFYEKLGFVKGEMGIFEKAMVEGLMVMEWANAGTD